MADQADGQSIYSVAILIVQGNNWTLEANTFVARSHDDARMKALCWAKETYPGAEGCGRWGGYHVKTCVLSSTDVIDEFVKIINERSDSGKELAALEKKLEEVRRLHGFETEEEPIFTNPESDQLQ